MRLGSAKAGAEAKEERRADVAHGDVGEGDVFDNGAVDGFEREAPAAFKDAVGDGDVLETAVGFGADLMRPVPHWRPSGMSHRLARAVEHRAKFVDAADVAVGDGEVLCGARVAESKGALRADAVVPRRVDGAVGDANVAAAVDVDAVAVGVDLEVVDGEVVDAGGEDAEVAAVKDGEIAEDDVAAVLEGDGLVADAGRSGVGQRLFVVSAAQALAPDEAGAEDAEVVDVLRPR